MPSEGRSRWPYVAAALLVVALVGIAVWRTGQDEPVTPPARLTLPLPDVFGTWTREDDAATARAEDALQQSVTQGGAAIDVALALYGGDAGDHARITVFLPRPGSSSARDLAGDPTAQLEAFLHGTGVARAHPEDSGEVGRTLQCGSATGEFARACGWADATSLVLVAFDRSGLEPDDAAGLTRQIRDGLLGS